MKSLLNAIRTRFAMFTLLPLDHYTALGIGQDATNAEIEIAYQIAVDQVTRHRLSRIVGAIGARALYPIHWPGLQRPIRFADLKPLQAHT